MSSHPLIIGYHARKTGFKTYMDAYNHAVELITQSAPDVTPCVAMFVVGPRNTHVNITSQVAHQLGARTRGEILFHASYLDLPWASILSDSTFDRVDRIMKICAQARADVVIHSGSRIFESRYNRPVLARLYESIARVRSELHPHSMPRIFIETMPHDARFGSTAALNTIFDDMPREVRESDDRHSIGICVDTAHIWAAGANISTRATCHEWFSSLRSDIPIAIHLNDSKEVIGTRHDIHTTLGDGEIWSLEDGYVAVLEWAREHESPVILERNEDPEQEARKDLTLISHKLN